MATLPLDVYVPSINRTLDNVTLQYCQLPLFEIIGLSREEYPIFSQGLCPDTWSSFGFSITYLVVYFSQLVLSLIGIIWKRNNGFIQARNPVYMVWSSWSSVPYVLLTNLRLLIGRKIFPCAVYTFTYFLFPPSLILPITLRCTRAFFLYKLNLLKTKLFDDSPDKLPKPSAEKKQETKLMETISSTSTIETLSTTPLGSNSSILTSSNLKISLMDETEDESGKISDPTLKKDFRLLKVYEFLSSPKIMYIAYAVAFSLSIGAWLLFGIIEESIYSNDPNPNKKRIFLIEGGMLVFTVGCSVTITTILIIAVIGLVLLVFEIAFLILLILSDRDTWNIKKETIVQLAIQIFAAILFLVLSQLHDFDSLIDFIWPYTNLIFYFVLVDNFICSILPIIYAIRKDKRDANLIQDNVEEKSDLERILSEKKTFDILLDFGRRSYCTESILCYRDIQEYRKLKKTTSKKTNALRIINSYLKKDAPYELNMPKVDQRGEELKHVVESSSTEVSTDLFQSVQEHCLNDMKDVFERLKSANREIQSLVLSWRNTKIASD